MSGQAPESAAAYLPARLNLKSLRDAAAGCKGCQLYQRATQTVFGEGLRRAKLMLVGETPGDQEDKQGRPFVGPAGRLLRDSMHAADLDPKQAYITNAVKHFKWELRGKRRIHKKPHQREIEACSPWLQAELQVIQPEVVVCLGATAVRSLFGRSLRLRDVRGRFHQAPLHPTIYVTVHPASIVRLRGSDQGAYREAYEHFVRDLETVAQRLREQG